MIEPAPGRIRRPELAAELTAQCAARHNRSLDDPARSHSGVFAMKRVSIALALCVMGIGMNAARAVEKGDKAPTFEATDDQGNLWKSSDHVGKSVLVVYFFPAALTGGCTKQACAYRDDMPALKEKGVEVVGVSGDEVKGDQLFKKVHNLNFTLLADEKGDVAKAFGVPARKGGVFHYKDKSGEVTNLTTGVRTARWTFVIDKNGTIVMKNTHANPVEDSKAVLKLVDSLK
jgi:thioredoxin-dependent peroxiredoxin